MALTLFLFRSSCSTIGLCSQLIIKSLAHEEFPIDVSMSTDARFIATSQNLANHKNLLLDGLAESSKLNIGFLKMLGGSSGPKKTTRG
jgi:hypothetical protein